MDLQDLIAVLRDEIHQARSDIDAALDAIVALPDGDPALAEQIESYATRIGRIGDAAGVVGIHGLQRACAVVQDAAGGLIAANAAQRSALKSFFAAWPDVVLAYLAAPGEPASIETLVTHLSGAPGEPAPEDMRALAEMLAAPHEMPAELLQSAAPDRARLATAEDVLLEVPTDVDANVYAAFIDDAPAQAARLNALMDACMRGENQAEDLREAKRIAHTFKGTAAIIGIRGVATLAHHAEDLLEYIETQPASIPYDLWRTLVDTAACLDQMVYALLGQEEPPPDALAVLQRLLDWANRIDAGDVDAPSPPPVQDEADDVLDFTTPAPRPEPLATELEDLPAPVFGSVEPQAPPAAPVAERSPPPARATAPSTDASFRVPVTTIDEMLRLIGDLTTRLGDAEAHVQQLTERARELLARQQGLQRTVEQVEDMVDLRGTVVQRQAARSTHGEFDPLELDRYHELHGTTHALMEEASDARELALSINEDLQRMASVLHGQHYAYRELQHLVLGTRLAPVSTLLPRLNRNVRQTCQATGKEAELVVEGSDVSIDAEVLNQLADPLLHVLRNAVDHGIERPEDREAAGKSRVGRIVLQFARQGEGVSVRCQDDGRGLDLERIHRKAVERGLIEPDQTLSEAEVAQLLLLPGFSTRDTVTEISGRGVGLDVVAERVKAMKGAVTIGSNPGAGTAIEMRVQASLSMVHALLLEVNGAFYAAPSQHIEFVLSAGDTEAGEDDGGEPQIRVRDLVCRARRLGDLIFGSSEPLTAEAAIAYPAVVIRRGEDLVAVLVDKVHDARNLVLKGAGRYLGLLRGVAGVSVAHNGRVLPLLDLPDLFADTERVRLATSARQALSQQILQRKVVLIADDSQSVRRMLRELVEDLGFMARTAKDGVEALNMLRSEKADLLLTDLEMPNMNGLQLTTSVRATPELAQLPVIMITSRSTEKHRRQAAEAGVNVYLTKPYTEADLMQYIRATVGVA